MTGYGCVGVSKLLGSKLQHGLWEPFTKNLFASGNPTHAIIRPM